MKNFLTVLVLLLVVHPTNGGIWEKLFNRGRGSNKNNKTDPHNNGHGYDDILKADDYGLREQAPFGITFVNNTCLADTSTDSPCYVGRSGNGTRGSWVCRTLFDPLTGDKRVFSACVDRTRFLSSDQCNCCGGNCPPVQPCACACNITKSSDDRLRRFLKRGDGNSTNDKEKKNTTGVLVNVGSTTQCVPADASVKIVTGSGFFGPTSCVTTCP